MTTPSFEQTRAFLRTTREWSRLAPGATSPEEQSGILASAVRFAVDRVLSRPRPPQLPAPAATYEVPCLLLQARFLTPETRLGATVWLILEMRFCRALNEAFPLQLGPITARWAHGTDGKPLDLTGLGNGIANALRKRHLRQYLLAIDPSLAGALDDCLVALATAAADSFDHGGLGQGRTVLIQDLAVSVILLGSLFAVIHYAAVEDSHHARAIEFLSSVATRAGSSQPAARPERTPGGPRRNHPSGKPPKPAVTAAPASLAAPPPPAPPAPPGPVTLRTPLEALSALAVETVLWMEEWGLQCSFEESPPGAAGSVPGLSLFDLGGVIGANDLTAFGSGYVREIELFGHRVRVETAPPPPHVPALSSDDYEAMADLARPLVQEAVTELARLLGRHYQVQRVARQPRGSLEARWLHRLLALNDVEVFAGTRLHLDPAARVDFLLLCDWSCSTAAKHPMMRRVLVSLLEVLRAASSLTSNDGGGGLVGHVVCMAQHSTGARRITLRPLLDHPDDGSPLTTRECAQAVRLHASGVNMDAWAAAAALVTHPALAPQPPAAGEAATPGTVVAILIGDSWPVSLLPGSADAASESRDIFNRLKALYGRRLVLMGVHSDPRFATADYYDYAVSLSSLDDLATFHKRFITLLRDVLRDRTHPAGHECPTP